MSLRARMGLAGGVAVALAVIAVAVSAYAGTRSELRGQVDNSLRRLAAPIVIRAHGGRTGRRRHRGQQTGPRRRWPGGGSARRSATHAIADDGTRARPSARGPGIRRRRGHCVSSCTAAGAAVRRPSGSTRCRSTRDAKALAAASGSGQYFTDVQRPGGTISACW